jgi:hypothetical protein
VRIASVGQADRRGRFQRACAPSTASTATPTRIQSVMLEFRLYPITNAASATTPTAGSFMWRIVVPNGHRGQAHLGGTCES